MVDKYSDTFEKLQSEVPGFIAAALVDLDTGMTLGTRSTRPDFDLSVAGAFNAELLKQKQKTMKALNLKSGLEDVLLTLSDQVHIIKFVTPKTFLYLAADKAQSNLAIVRTAVSKYLGAMA
jgi:predicted regulator of Ras-like GTPase activity (Roadblock/LC7/MglB family)